MFIIVVVLGVSMVVVMIVIGVVARASGSWRVNSFMVGDVDKYVFEYRLIVLEGFDLGLYTEARHSQNKFHCLFVALFRLHLVTLGFCDVFCA